MHPGLSYQLASAHFEELRREAAEGQRRSPSWSQAGPRSSRQAILQDVRGRLTSSRFVGRNTQLTELELAFREACEQQPRMILLGGDSGIGKSRFLTEAERSFDGARVLLGQCVEQGEVELPYAPLLGALRPLARERDPVLEELSAAGRAGLAPLLPSLGAAAGPAEPGFSGQIRLFESLLELLHLLSSQQPRGAGARGHALGRQLDSGIRRVSGPKPDRRAADAAGQLPQRRVAPTASAAAAARRAQPPGAVPQAASWSRFGRSELAEVLDGNPRRGARGGV